MRVSTFHATVLVLVVTFWGNALATAQPIAIALSGQPAPGGGSYGVFSTSTNFFPATINSSGRVYFYSPDIGTPPPLAGMFAGTPGSVMEVARQGSPSPAGPNFTNSFSANRQNDAGQVVFSCSLQPSGQDPVQGLFFGTPGALQKVAFTGNPAPGGVGNYAVGFSSPILSASGTIAYSVGLTGGPGPTGLFVGTPGSIQPIAINGQPAPGGGNYAGFFRTGGLTAAGQLLFTSITSGNTPSSLFFGTPGSVQAIARVGNPTPAGGTYDFVTPGGDINSAGKLTFHAGLNGVAASSGIFAGNVGSLQTVVLEGDTAPDAGGSVFTTLQAPVVNGPGQVAFRASMTGTAGSATAGIFLQTAGVLDDVALHGGAAPGGGVFNTFDSNPQLNNLGQLAFQATLSGAGVNPDNDKGLYVGSLQGVIKVVREGEVVDVDPGVGVDLRTIASIGFDTGGVGGQDGRGTSFTDNGLIAYTLAFTDNTSGVFYSNISAVPELSTLVLLGCSIPVGLWCWSRYSSRKHSGIEAELTQEQTE